MKYFSAFNQIIGEKNKNLYIYLNNISTICQGPGWFNELGSWIT